MTKWWDSRFSSRVPVTLVNPNGLPRRSEPVLLELPLPGGAHPNSIRVVADDGEEVRSQVFDAEGEALVERAGVAMLADMPDERAVYHVYYDAEDRGAHACEGIRQLPPVFADGVRRLDTGHYLLELCRGTADGTAWGKWGIRAFQARAEGRELIKGGANAIGGFYGPFFTPANGLINPPEHTVVEVEAEVEGPLYCRYRFRGDIPPGLDPNLRDKSFEIVWQFFADTPWFIRTYHVDRYETVVDKMPVADRITVGDEYESGQGQVVFSRFGAYGGTRYRTGDPYARILAEGVNRLLELPDGSAPAGLKRFKEAIGDDINAVSWDYFWRLFCVREGVLTDDEIREHVREILSEAHEAIHASDRTNDYREAVLVDVGAEPDQTIFPVNASKTVELNPDTGWAMVWRTSAPVARYQIVQRPASGWVNWGTNGENEYPELPIGSTIHTAYGQFPRWQDEADRMESPLQAVLGTAEGYAR